MKLTVLVDNHSLIDKYYLAEPALSFYIEDDDKRILVIYYKSTVYGIIIYWVDRGSRICIHVWLWTCQKV